MALTHSLITLNQTAQILTDTALQEIPYEQELVISIQNLDSSHYVFLGDSTVTTSSYGFRIDPDQTFTIVLSAKDEIYAVTDVGNTQIAILKVQS
mgnify:CR=1 FL=1